MQTFFSSDYLQTDEGREADRILRSCVHCGFCTATCPTFLLGGNELDSPRGRIYLIKEALEGKPVSAATQRHLDRCLSCQACESTCPSDVQYHALLDIGRRRVEERVGRPRLLGVKRYLLRRLLGSPALFGRALRLGQAVRGLLPDALRRLIPVRRDAAPWPRTNARRRMILLNGCVQNSLSPNTNAAAARVLARLGIQAWPLPNEGCCGALAYHMNAQEEGLRQARRQIDRLCLQLDQGAEAIVSSASGCGNFIKDYERVLAQDPEYAAKARRVAAYTRDISEVLAAEDLSALKPRSSRRLAFQCPCTLQHGQRLGATVETLLRRLDFSLTPVREGHLCCGSAGSYSILQPELARQLRANKLSALEAGRPEAIATANIGCQHHLAAASSKSVKHWIEYLDEALDPPASLPGQG